MIEGVFQHLRHFQLDTTSFPFSTLVKYQNTLFVLTVGLRTGFVHVASSVYLTALRIDCIGRKYVGNKAEMGFTNKQLSVPSFFVMSEDAAES